MERKKTAAEKAYQDYLNEIRPFMVDIEVLQAEKNELTKWVLLFEEEKRRDMEEARKQGYAEGVKVKEPEIAELQKAVENLQQTLDNERKKHVVHQEGLEQKIRDMKDKIDGLTGQKKSSDEEIGRLREEIKLETQALLDSQKEISELQGQLSDATSRQVTLEGELKSKCEGHTMILNAKDEQISKLEEENNSLQATEKDVSKRTALMVRQAVNTVAQPEAYRIPEELPEPSVLGKVQKIIDADVDRRMNTENEKRVREEAKVEVERLKKTEWPKFMALRIIETQKKVTSDLSNLLGGKAKIRCDKCGKDTVINEVQLRCLSCVDFEALDLAHLLPKQHIIRLGLRDIISSSLTS